MGTKIFAKVGLAVLLLAMPAFSNEIAAVPDSAVQPASYCIPDPDPNNERPGGGGKIATFLPALVWNPKGYASGDSLYQTLLSGGYQATLTPDLTPFVDSLSGYHLFVMARWELDHELFSWEDFEPFSTPVILFLQNGGCIYWEGGGELGSVEDHFPAIEPYFQIGFGGSAYGAVNFLKGFGSPLYGDIFADIDSLVTLDPYGPGVLFGLCGGDDSDIIKGFNPGSGGFVRFGVVCRANQTRTMTTDMSWARMNDSGLNTRVDLINDVMEWLSGPVSVEDAEPLPKEFSLANPYPNPFNAQTTIEYALPRASNVRLQVYDITGRVVATIASGIYPAGYYRETWDAKDKASGVYFVRLVAGEFKETRKIVLLK